MKGAGWTCPNVWANTDTFGNNPVYLAIRNDAAWISAGPNGLDALKSALSAQPQVAPQMRLDMSLEVAQTHPERGRGLGPAECEARSVDQSLSGLGVHSR